MTTSVKVSLTLKIENTHGENTAVFLTHSADTLEEAEQSIVQELFIDGASKLVDLIYKVGSPTAKVVSKKGKKNEVKDSTPG